MRKSILNYRIGSLELRKTETISKTPKEYLEIVEWIVGSNGNSCITIAIFREGKEGYDLESVGDRILVNEWADLKVLIKSGFEFLEGKKWD